MPIYEYRCKKNGHQFEVIQKISDPPLRTCIHCKSKVEKLVSASAFVLKGSGFYVNDYVRKNGEGEKKPKGEKGAAKESSAASTSEASEVKSAPEKSSSSSGASAATTT